MGAGVVKDFRSVLASPPLAVATLLGAGLVPVWPGTVGSALALPLVFILQPLGITGKVAVFTLLFAVCVWAAHRAGQLLGEPDHRAIICDETWSMAAVWECTPADWHWMVTSFVAFRLFDAIKPWPISTIDRRMKNGLGVMLDDGLAAIASIALVLAAAAALARPV